MKKVSVLLVSLLALTGCGSASSQVVSLAEKTIQKDETALNAMAQLKEKEENFLTHMSDIMMKAENNFDETSEDRKQALVLLEEITKTTETQKEALVLPEKTKNKVEKLMNDLATEEYSMADSFLSYKNDLAVYLNEQAEVYEAYETFLTTVKGDTPFKELEMMIATINSSLEEANSAYETYATSASNFSSQYTQLTNK